MNHSTTMRLALFSALCTAVGCSSAVRLPRLPSPGPAQYQRAAAQDFDPYPLNDLGPEIVGGRPREFQKPLDEVTRSRQQLPFGPTQQAQPVLPPQPVVIPQAAGVPRY